MDAGDIYRDTRFYVDPNGELKPKFLLVLAVPGNGEIIARLLTSRSHGRPEDPPCFHGMPYGGYFLGIPGNSLTLKTWVDLRSLPDLDATDFRTGVSNGSIIRAATLAIPLLCDVLACVAAADDTTKQQERYIRDVLSELR